ncbi:iron-containing alcohol dehydrogenase [Acuticoccus sp. M5D2P5]|uniref:iron-containing alcohol dehydrogenase n=1 Tax=Acuticoccus kalidii TaxID=2910977 RepID=UPI001F346A8D|nr:iron-containing alcohol dehydrogenase [Acuticoccus kalidii]MCF3936370.1 iron-containing alcohol dehydrogenase [Acuticoccus kalidii]
MTKANWSYPTQIRFGPGRIDELARACRTAGIARPLFVTDPVVAGLPIAARALEILAAEGLTASVFSGVDPNPIGANVEAGIAAYRAGDHDGVIAFGGGSALDAGKAIAFQQGQNRPLWDFEDIGDYWTRADADAIAPVIAVPTTAGTGSEVGRAAVVTHEAIHTKKVIFHPKMLPVCVIADPELTVPMPPKVTAGTGMDALAHCLEAYSSPFYHPMSEGIAVEGVRLCKEALPRVMADGTDIEARGDMMSAAAMGAVAFQKGLGAIHALSHPVGALYNTHHGLTNAVFMPYVLAFNRPAIEDKIERLGKFIGVDGGFDGFLGWIIALRREIGIPNGLKAIGVDDTKIDIIAEMAVVDPTAGGNPRPLDAAAAREIFRRAYEEDLGL